MSISKIEGLVIRKVDYKDADRILTVFSPNRGKITLSIKGIRKSKKREKIATDILTISNFVIYENRWKTISDIELVNSFDNIRNSLDKIMYASYILKIINNILMEEEERRNLYELTIKILEYISKSDEKAKILYALFNYLIEIIKEEGLEIKKSSEIYEKNFYFNLEYGKIEYTSIDKGIVLNQDIFNIFKYVLDNKIKELLKKNIKDSDVLEAIGILEKYLEYQLDIKIKLKDLLGRI